MPYIAEVLETVDESDQRLDARFGERARARCRSAPELVEMAHAVQRPSGCTQDRRQIECVMRAVAQSDLDALRREGVQ